MRLWWVVVVCGCSGVAGSTLDGGSVPGDDGGALQLDAGTPVDGGSAVDGGSPSLPPIVCAPPLSLVDVSNPTSVVGTGTRSSCTEAALRSALSLGGVITFACGGPATITLSATLSVRTDVDTTLDGAGLITLDGQHQVRLLEANHPNFRTNDHALTLQRLTLINGKASGQSQYPTAPAPCSQGFYDGAGGAVYVRDMVLRVFDSFFFDNEAAPLGPDVGGGAIYLAGAKRSLISGSTFARNFASNGGAVGTLNADLDVYNSVFEGNTATGNGANSDDATKCAVLDPLTHQHQVGSGGNGGALCCDGGSDGAKTLCGVRFTGNHGGAGALGGALFRTPDLSKQTTTVDRCTFDANTVDQGGGGAMYLHNSTLRLRASTLSDNRAKGPGGIQADGTTLDVQNVTFSGNAATAGLGGAVALFGGDGAIGFSTFVNNTAEGGDPYFGAAITAFATLQLDGDLFMNNTAANPGAPMQCRLDASTGTGNLQWPRKHRVGSVDDAACAPGITFADAQLGALAAHGGPTLTLLPAAGSAAIGAASGCPPSDQRGQPRPSTSCTAGAVEGWQ